MAEVSPWVAALAALPPKIRLEVQKTVAQDMVAQRDMPPQPSLSRAYCSGDSDKLAPTGGIGVFSSSLDGLGVGKKATGSGHHLTAVKRTFPSTAALLAQMIVESSRQAQAQPKVPYGTAHHAPAPVGQLSLQAEIDALTEEIRHRHLDDAYRVTLARYLQRALEGASKPGQASATALAGWEEEARAHPELYESLQAAADGTLAAQAQSAFEALQPQKGTGQSAGTCSAGTGAKAGNTGTAGAPAGESDDLDALLDAAMDELLG